MIDNNLERTDSISEVLAGISGSQVLHPFAREELNPFDSEESLQEFARSIKFGQGIDIHIPNLGAGVSVQLRLIQQFFAEYFPLMNISSECKEGEIAITVNTVDFRLPGFSVDSPNSDKFILPLTCLKVLNISAVSTEERLQLREALFTNIELNGPIVVGSVSPEIITQTCENHTVTQPFTYLWVKLSEVEKYKIIPGEKDSENLFKNAVNIPPLSLRYLYSVGDFAVVSGNHNKMEPINLGIPTIALPSSGNNSNAATDVALFDLKCLLDISRFEKNGFYWEPKNTAKNRGFHSFVYNATTRIAPSFEPSIKNVMSSLFSAFESRARILSEASVFTGNVLRNV